MCVVVVVSELEAEAELPGAGVQELSGDNGTDTMTTPMEELQVQTPACRVPSCPATCSESLCLLSNLLNISRALFSISLQQ